MQCLLDCLFGKNSLIRKCEISRNLIKDPRASFMCMSLKRKRNHIKDACALQPKFKKLGVSMSKDHLNEKKKMNEGLSDHSKEVLEISSTGYGLESVQENPDSTRMKNNPSSCGGL